MNFSYGVIAAVGVLVAISLGLIATAPDDIIEPRIVSIEDISVNSYILPKTATVDNVLLIEVEFRDDGKKIVDHVNYDIIATQDGNTILSEPDSHRHPGMHPIHETSVLSESPLEIQVTLQGLGHGDDISEPKGDVTTVTVNPEVGPIACTMEYAPVCGVNGETYGNLCMLDASHIKLDYEGECIVAEPAPEPVEETSSTSTDNLVVIGTVEQSGFSQDCVADGCYTPNTTTVGVGGVVTMTNTDTTGVHTFTSGTVDGFTPSPSGIFDSDILLSGDSFEWIPDTAGEVPYYCILHTWMQGTIIVQQAETMMEEEIMMEEETMEVEETSDPMALTISIPKGVGAPGCETTLECYLPYETTVKAGTTVTWINEDTTVHTVTSGRITEGTTGLFDSSIFTFGKSFDYTFNVPGTYDYFCNVHPWMAGIVHVS